MSLPNAVAGALVFFTSGIVLVLEILGVRLLAPFVGASLDTYTAIIGITLAGISLGTWLGGKAADRIEPLKLLGPLFLLGGAMVLLTIPLIRLTAETTSGTSSARVVFIAFCGLFFPAALLSAISPTIVKLQLGDLHKTGSVVGRLSALATAGAIVGTFLTGFVLVGTFRMSHIVVVMGVVLLVAGCALTIYGNRINKRVTAVAVSLSMLGLVATTSLPQNCDVESKYFCVQLIAAEGDESDVILKLDDVFHSYVDKNDPTDLKFWYTREIGRAIDAALPANQSINTVSVGGAAMTLPRYIEATRPGSQSTVLEIDEKMKDINHKYLGLADPPGLTIRIGDARTGIRSVATDSQDVVIGDAFSKYAVPWHLATREFMLDIKRVLKDDGVYMLNVIDFEALRLLRSELQTLKSVFGDVSVSAQRDGDKLEGNFIVIARDAGAPAGSLSALDAESRKIEGEQLTDFIGNDAFTLTDDFAPADQLASNL